MESIHLLPHFLLQAFWGPRTPTGRKGHRSPLRSESCQETLTTDSSLRTRRSLCQGPWAALRTGHYRESSEWETKEQESSPSHTWFLNSLPRPSLHPLSYFFWRERANKLHLSLLNKMVVLSPHTITPVSILVSTLEIHAAFGKSLKKATKVRKCEYGCMLSQRKRTRMKCIKMLERGVHFK